VKDKTQISPEQRSHKKGFFTRLRTTFADEERRAYIVLAVFMVVLTLAAGGFSIVQTHILEHKFCQLLDVSIQNPVPQPSDPKANPSREHDYEEYSTVVSLDHSLGCTGVKNSGG
jgi:hypothetical protein